MQQLEEHDLQTGIIGSRFSKLIGYLSGLKKMASLANKQGDKEALLDTMLKIVFEHLDAEEVSLYIREDEVLDCVANLNWDQFSNNESAIGNKSKTCKMGQGYVGKTAVDQQIMHVTNCSMPALSSDKVRDFDSGSVIYAPIMSDNRVTGVVELYHPHSNHFDAWQEYSISIYADMLGMLLEYQRLLTDMQSQVNERTVELRQALRESDRLRKRYEEMSILDHLTKLYNRRFFFNEVASGLSRAVRYHQSFSLLLMDLDHFKRINDTYGHDCGDQALRHVATVLSRFIREGDTLARYGGEEFILALPNTNHAGAMNLAERIRKTIEEHSWEWQDKTIKLTISVGLTSMHENEPESEDIVNFSPQVADLIREADRALYYVKQHGRNDVKAFSELPDN